MKKKAKQKRLPKTKMFFCRSCGRRRVFKSYLKTKSICSHGHVFHDPLHSG